jgi:hypothetical protein
VNGSQRWIRRFGVCFCFRRWLTESTAKMNRCVADEDSFDVEVFQMKS